MIGSVVLVIFVGVVGFNIYNNMGNTTEPKIINEFDIEYTEKGDGTYECRGYNFQYKKKVTGLENGQSTTFVILTNNKEVDFDTVSDSLKSSQANTDAPEFIILGWY